MLCPAQMLLAPVITKLGLSLIVTVKLVSLWHPNALVTVNVYVVVVLGVTTMELVASPVDQKYVDAELEINVALSPGQMTAFPKMVGAAAVCTLTVTDAVDVH